MTKNSLLSLATTLLLAPALFAQDGAEPFLEDFEGFPAGREPDLFILDGNFTVEKDAENQVLQLSPDPLAEGVIQLGKSLKGGGEVTARIKGTQKRRSYPRFGVALHGMSGYKLRVVPAQGVLELVKNDEIIQTTPFEWTTDQWYNLRLRVRQLDDERWSVSGWVWAEASKEPEMALIDYIGEEGRLQGKGAIVGTPYSGHPIWFDDVKILSLD